MADKLYLVKATIETKDKNGKKVVILRSDQPQPVPSWLIKELKAEGVIDVNDGGLTVGKAAPGGDGSDQGGGDGNSGD